jgi:hypothetical protein
VRAIQIDRRTVAFAIVAFCNFLLTATMIFLKLRACLEGKRQFLEKNGADAPLSAQQRRELETFPNLAFLTGHTCDRATRLLDAGLDFCCERSVAGDAGGAVATP